MEKQSFTAGRWVLLVGILAVALLGVYGTTQAAETEGDLALPSARAKWMMHVQFPATTISATVLITARVGMAQYERTIDISPSCAPQAGAVINMNQAIMGPTGYLQCQMPDLAAQVADMTGGALILPPMANCPADGHAWGQGIVALGAFVNAGMNPLFSHPDVQYEMPFVGTGAPALTVLRFSLGNYHVNSTPFRPRAPWNGVRTDLVCNGVNCGWRHWANGTVRSTGSSAAPMVTMTTSSVPVYIGFDPTNQKTLAGGKLYELEVDPGCSMVGN